MVGDVLVHNKQVCTEVCIVFVYQLAGPLFMYVLLGGGPGEPGPSEMVRRVQAMRGLWLGGPGLRGDGGRVDPRFWDSKSKQSTWSLENGEIGVLEMELWASLWMLMGILYVCSVLSLLEYYGSFWCKQGLSYYGDVA